MLQKTELSWISQLVRNAYLEKLNVPSCIHMFIDICWFMQIYTYIYWIHTDAMITDAWSTTDARIKDAWWKTQEDFFTNSLPLTLLQGLKRVTQSLHVRGCWRLNINFIFWPNCYDRHVVSLLFSWCWGLLHRGFPRFPSVGCGLPYHISSLTLWESAGNCSGTQTQLS